MVGILNELSALGCGKHAPWQLTVSGIAVVRRHARDDAYRKKLAEKIDRPASEFATLEDLDRRLGLSGN